MIERATSIEPSQIAKAIANQEVLKSRGVLSPNPSDMTFEGQLLVCRDGSIKGGLVVVQPLCFSGSPDSLGMPQVFRQDGGYPRRRIIGQFEVMSLDGKVFSIDGNKVVSSLFKRALPTTFQEEWIRKFDAARR